LADGRQATHRQPDHVIIIAAIDLLNTAMSITTEIKASARALRSARSFCSASRY
jgi:hypothetical protein